MSNEESSHFTFLMRAGLRQAWISSVNGEVDAEGRPAARGEVLNLLHLSGTGDQATIVSTMLTALWARPWSSEVRL